MIDANTFIPLFAALVNLFVLSYVFGQRQNNATNKAFILFSFFIFLILLLEFCIRLPESDSYLNVFTRVAMAIFIILGILYANFIFEVISRKRDSVFYIFLLFALCCSLFSLFIAHPHLISVGQRGATFVTPPLIYIPFFLAVALPSTYAGYLLFRAYRAEKTINKRKQYALLFWGVIISLAYSLIWLIFMPLLLHNYILYQFTSISTIIHVAFIYRAIYRYRFMTIDGREIEIVSQLLFRNIDEAVVISDQSGNIIQRNDKACNLCDQFKEAQNLLPLEKHLDDYRFEKEYRNHAASCTCNGKTRHLVISQSTMFSHEIPIGKITIIRDVTEQKRVEEEIARKNRIESLGLLAGGIAHDFNNQLAGIMGCADILRTELASDANNHELADMIVKAARRSSDLTNQLLAFARRGKFQSTLVSMHSVISEVVAMLEHSIDKKIVITKQLKSQNPWVNGDPSQLHHVFLNIALNARDAMPEGGEIVFSTEDTQLDASGYRQSPFEIQTGNYVCVAVTDTGSGMDQEVQKRVFEPFYTTKEKGKGSGMGLAAVYGIVRNHNGAVELVSKSGKGSTLTVYFPAADSEEELLVKDSPEKAERKTARILLIDDEKIVRTSLTKILELAGHDVTICNNGREGVCSYKESWQNFDLVILDLIMPKMDGHEAFIELQKINRKVKVLLISGYSLNGDAQKTLDRGACGFMQKPFEAEELLKKINEVLSDTSRSRKAQEAL